MKTNKSWADVERKIDKAEKTFDIKSFSDKFDNITNVYLDGKNIKDFIDPDILSKVAALEKEEDMLLKLDAMQEVIASLSILLM